MAPGPYATTGLDKVTGRARYGADINLPGLLYGKILRSPHAHARIKSIDTSKAEALPGVRAVVTYKDFVQISDKAADVGEGEIRNIGFMSRNCMAHEKALYKGPRHRRRSRRQPARRGGGRCPHQR